MRWLDYVFPVLYAILLWWVTTGVVMLVYKRPRWIMRLFFAGTTLALLASLAGLLVTRHLDGAEAVYISITCGVVIWGWQVAGYYLGFVTGPGERAAIAADRQPMPSPQRGIGARFWLAVRYSLYHELFALAFALLIAAIVLPYGNPWGLWIYLTLWLMHTSAKLNVFLGVRNFRIELLPRRMHYLDALLTKRASNLFFPVSIVLASSVVLILLAYGFDPDATPAQTSGAFLVATMIALGIFEHWLLVLPLPTTLWGWSLYPQAKKTETAKSHIENDPHTTTALPGTGD